VPVYLKNRLLSSLSPENRDLLVAKCVPVDLPLRTSLYVAEELPPFAYFMTSGMASIVTTMEDGETAEVGVVGNEGIIGSIFLLGPTKISTSSFIQLDGSALRISLLDLKHAYRSSEEIRDRLLEFVQEQSVTVSQIAGCNRLHGAEERLARWLLMAQDRTQSEVLNFTQEFLAMMLGARRTTVTLIAGSLQRANLIEYSRGRVKILDRENLKSAACDCYKITKALLTNLYSRRLAAVDDVVRTNGAAQPLPPHVGSVS
jgi:CRP-like cAMP-binding protein